jgi:hypothetical protein
MSSAVYKIGDTRQVLGQLPTASVDLVLTSPPFLAQRSYLPAGHPDKDREIGTESTPGAYVDDLLDVIEACRRVLAPHGSLCMEVGDTYAGSGGAGGDYGDQGLRAGQNKYGGTGRRRRPADVAAGVLAPTRRPGPADRDDMPGWPLDKSLCLTAELLRISLVYGCNPLTGRRTARWRVRNVVRWHRPNPAVGELADKFRPATSDLVVACMAKDRYFDLDPLRNPSDYHRPNLREKGSRTGGTPPGQHPNHSDHTANPAGAPPLDTWIIPTYAYKGAHYAAWPPDLCVRPVVAMCPRRVCTVCGEPSRRIVRTQRLTEPDDHTRRVDASVYRLNGMDQAPEAGWETAHTTAGWTDCGHHDGLWDDDWRPRLRTVARLERRRSKLDARATEHEALSRAVEVEWDELTAAYRGRIDGWHDGPDWRAGVVLDPFAGSGVTGLVATGHGRDFIGIDLDARNAELAVQRIGPLLLTVEPHEPCEAVG